MRKPNLGFFNSEDIDQTVALFNVVGVISISFMEKFVELGFAKLRSVLLLGSIEF